MTIDVEPIPRQVVSFKIFVLHTDVLNFDGIMGMIQLVSATIFLNTWLLHSNHLDDPTTSS